MSRRIVDLITDSLSSKIMMERKKEKEKNINKKQTKKGKKEIKRNMNKKKKEGQNCEKINLRGTGVVYSLLFFVFVVPIMQYFWIAVSYFLALLCLMCAAFFLMIMFATKKK